MKYKEIGSEFQSVAFDTGEGIVFPKKIIDSVFTFSGRTAIETVLKNEPSIRNVLLPSYCCDSMIEPFRRANLRISFYPVYYDDGLKIDLDIEDDIDCLLWCNYFGFKIKMPDLSAFINRGGIIIEDITHSLLSNKQYNYQSHYLIASIRKWGPVLSGGYCASIKKLKYKPTKKPDSTFLKLKKSAMDKKREFLKGDNQIEKRVFLEEFASSNFWFVKNYSGLTIDGESLKIVNCMNQKRVKEIRKRNASVLYSGLNDNESVKFLFEIDKMDCPLFVPIIIRAEIRDKMRKQLIEKDIYCPIHWPKPVSYFDSNLYDMELSLICDQRYEKKDMERIVDVICKVGKEKLCYG